MVEDVLSWTIDQIDTLVFAAVASSILIRIHARLALLAALPTVGVIAIARLAGARVERYRRASWQATERVTRRWARRWARR